MSFEIAARAILHLGADLISSDAVALYELVKNAIDAKSKSGVDVQFFITILEADFATFVDEVAAAEDPSLIESRRVLRERFVPDAPDALVTRFEEIISGAKTVSELLDLARHAYQQCNFIIVRDQGQGMSLETLRTTFLNIGTASRQKEIAAAMASGEHGQAPYLGEKGVGRLSAMRLGWGLHIETATERDSCLNVLDIDWSEFERAHDKPLSTVKVTPLVGPRKPRDFKSGTTITISDLRGSWTRNALMAVAQEQVARLMDPFSWTERRRFPIRITYNEQPIDHARVIAQELLANAHATCTGRYELSPCGPRLVFSVESVLYEGQKTTFEFDSTDLFSISGLKDARQPSSVLEGLGPFSFDFYWFNRQRLRGVEGLGDREHVRTLVRGWAGVCLFRDGYRVLPYGDEGDDWLGLDIEAFGAGGYKLNTKQIIGRVRIGRLANPRLLDQTNRQGLIDCPEKSTLIRLLRNVITERWHSYLNETGAAKKNREALGFDPQQAGAKVDAFEARAKSSLKTIRSRYKVDDALLQEVKDAFKEIKDAHEKAVARIGAIEEEKERLTQLAGIGLMTEVIAHELTRATERTLGELKSIGKSATDPRTEAAFRVLRQQIQVIQKRLRILDPLSIPARQKRTYCDLVEIAQNVVASHEEQFSRHAIRSTIKTTAPQTSAFVIEGHVVQILENLIANSVYWLDVQKADHQRFMPTIEVSVSDSPPRISVFDNGPGIPSQRAESVFEPFFSTKPQSAVRRRGLGLFIGRQSAEVLGGSLELDELGRVHEGRYNTIVATFREES